MGTSNKIRNYDYLWKNLTTRVIKHSKELCRKAVKSQFLETVYLVQSHFKWTCLMTGITADDFMRSIPICFIKLNNRIKLKLHRTVMSQVSKNTPPNLDSVLVLLHLKIQQLEIGTC